MMRCFLFQGKGSHLPHSQRADQSSAVNGFTPPSMALFQAHLHPVGICGETLHISPFIYEMMDIP